MYIHGLVGLGRRRRIQHLFFFCFTSAACSPPIFLTLSRKDKRTRLKKRKTFLPILLHWALALRRGLGDGREKPHIPFCYTLTHTYWERETLRALLCMWIYPLLHRLSLEWPHAVWEIDVHAHTLTYTHIQISLLLLVVVCVFHSTFHCIFPFYSFLFFYKKSSSCVHLKEQSHAHRYRFFFEYDGILYTRLCSVWLFLFTSSSSFFVPCPNILFYFWAVGNWLTRKKKSERNTRSTSCFTIWGRKWKRNLADFSSSSSSCFA